MKNFAKKIMNRLARSAAVSKTSRSTPEKCDMNQYNRPPFQTIGGLFPLSSGERAGVRPSQSNRDTAFGGVAPFELEVSPDSKDPIKNFIKTSSRIQSMNHCYHSTLLTIGEKFPLSLWERAGVRENRSNENAPQYTEPTRNRACVTVLLFALVLTLITITGCQRQTALVPTEIHYGVETCAECGMIISDPHYAAAVAWRDASDGSIQTAVFDDIGCLLAWRQHHARVQIAAVWVKNVHSTAWLDAPSAMYLKNPQLHTPMGGGIAAGATANDFATLPVHQPMLGWTNLLTAGSDQADNTSTGHTDKN